MKKFLALAALIAGVALTAVSATAGPLVATHLVHKQLWFRTHIAAPTAAQLALANSGYDGMGFYVDSTSATHAAAATFDTTVGVATAGWVLPPSTGLADSSGNAVVLFAYDAGGTSASADSLYIGAQVSAEGSNWVDVAACLGTPTPNAYLANTTVAGTVRIYLPINGTGASSNMWMTNYKTSTQFVAGVNPTVFNFVSWPFIRFIFKGTDTYKLALKAKVAYLSADEDLNK